DADGNVTLQTKQYPVETHRSNNNPQPRQFLDALFNQTPDISSDPITPATSLSPPAIESVSGIKQRENGYTPDFFAP
ncbi:MAG: hypothetical protein KDD76_01625, partial [Rickettsiales bacterium]|nr:hypothetical protein [Rickettsiales bacterium]